MLRRKLLWAFGGLAGLGAVTWWQRNNIARSLITRPRNQEVVLEASPEIDDELCILTPEQGEGPYFVPSAERVDIREDRNGLPLNLNIQVVKSDGCSPVTGARVEIWHCDAAGRYSGYPEELARKPFDSMMFLSGQPRTQAATVNEKTYLRGAQITDASGAVRFDTIVPGWYDLRAPHIHLKVIADGQSYLTTQLYFDDDLINGIYSTHSDYVDHGTTPYNIKTMAF